MCERRVILVVWTRDDDERISAAADVPKDRSRWIIWGGRARARPGAYDVRIWGNFRFPNYSVGVLYDLSSGEIAFFRTQDVYTFNTRTRGDGLQWWGTRARFLYNLAVFIYFFFFLRPIIVVIYVIHACTHTFGVEFGVQLGSETTL